MHSAVKIFLAALSALFAFTFTAAAQAAPRTVATIAPVHSLVAGVMAGAGEPYLLLDAAASPHTTTLRPSQARRVYNAELLVQVGGGLESFLTPMLESLPESVTVLTLIDVDGMLVLEWDESDGHDDEHDDHGDEHDDHGDEHDDHGHESAGHDDEHDDHGDEHDGHGHESAGHDDEHDGHEMESAGHGHEDHGHHHGPRDPHLWLDPANARVIVGELRDVLSAMDAANAAVYRANAAAMMARLETLEADLEAQMRPLRGAPYVVFHDAYRYFEARFGVRPVAFVTLDPERNPGARSSRELRETIRRARPRCLFSEPQFPPAVVATLTAGGGMRHSVLDPLGAGLTPGGDAYFQLLGNIGASMAECLGR